MALQMGFPGVKTLLIWGYFTPFISRSGPSCRGVLMVVGIFLLEDLLGVQSFFGGIIEA